MGDENPALRALERLDEKLDAKFQKLADDITEIKVDFAEYKTNFVLHLKTDDDNLKNIDNRLSEYNKSLIVHIKRSELLEEQTDILRQQLQLQKKSYETLIQDINSRIERLEKPRKILNGIKNSLITIGYVAAGVGAVWGAAGAVIKWILPLIK